MRGHPFAERELGSRPPQWNVLGAGAAIVAYAQSCAACTGRQGFESHGDGAALTRAHTGSAGVDLGVIPGGGPGDGNS